MVESGIALVLAVAFPVVAVAVGAWAYRDARARDHGEWAPFVAVAIGGAFLAGSVPGLVALAVAADPVVQGFPTALRVLPGFVALSAYLAFR